MHISAYKSYKVMKNLSNNSVFFHDRFVSSIARRTIRVLRDFYLLPMTTTFLCESVGDGIYCQCIKHNFSSIGIILWLCLLHLNACVC